jgi:hypothetical protein
LPEDGAFEKPGSASQSDMVRLHPLEYTASLRLPGRRNDFVPKQLFAISYKISVASFSRK